MFECPPEAPAPCPATVVPCPAPTVPCPAAVAPCTAVVVPCPAVVVPCTAVVVPCPAVVVAPCTAVVVPCPAVLVVPCTAVVVPCPAVVVVPCTAVVLAWLAVVVCGVVPPDLAGAEVFAGALACGAGAGAGLCCAKAMAGASTMHASQTYLCRAFPFIVKFIATPRFKDLIRSPKHKRPKPGCRRDSFDCLSGAQKKQRSGKTRVRHIGDDQLASCGEATLPKSGLYSQLLSCSSLLPSMTRLR